MFVDVDIIYFLYFILGLTRSQCTKLDFSLFQAQTRVL